MSEVYIIPDLTAQFLMLAYYLLHGPWRLAPRGSGAAAPQGALHAIDLLCDQ